MNMLKRFAVIAIVFAFFSCTRSDINRQADTDIPSIIPDSIMNNVPSLPDNPAMAYVRNLGMAINIGNTLDALGHETWYAGETGWGNPRITREFIRALKNFGYKTIRLPVTWAEHMGPAPDYIIQEERMSRVEEVVNWILEEDMYVMVNLHHDGGHGYHCWILDAGEDLERINDQFAKVWAQIARRFAGVSQERLIFESMNEVGFDNLWNRYGGGGNKTEAFRRLNILNQTFVDTVRGIPGNENRFLLIAGYWTDIHLTSDPLFEMPADTIDHRLIISVHYYTPSTFCIAEERDNSWGFREDWGTYSDYVELVTNFDILKFNFLEKGIPAILGEYGATMKNKDELSRIKWMAAVTQLSLNYGVCPALWDTGGEISRHPPYEMRDSLKAVWEAIKVN